MTQVYRYGFIGALLDEYERAIANYQQVILTLTDEQFNAIVDIQTADPDCVSVETITRHVINAGYGYANYIRRQYGDEPVEHNRNYTLPDAITACILLNKMFQFNVQTLQNKMDITDDVILQNIIHVTWGQKYDMEQLLEHAIVHVLRHRRQVEKFKTLM